MEAQGRAGNHGKLSCRDFFIEGNEALRHKSPGYQFRNGAGRIRALFHALTAGPVRREVSQGARNGHHCRRFAPMQGTRAEFALSLIASFYETCKAGAFRRPDCCA
jgi:hypothetical protein